MSSRTYDWNDEARLVVWPPGHPSPIISGNLAYCVRRAVEIADGHPPGVVEIHYHAPVPIPLAEIRRMFADSTFPREEIAIEDLAQGPMG